MSSSTSSLSILTIVPLTSWPSSTSTIVPSMASAKATCRRSSTATSRGGAVALLVERAEPGRGMGRRRGGGGVGDGVGHGLLSKVAECLDGPSGDAGRTPDRSLGAGIEGSSGPGTLRPPLVVGRWSLVLGRWSIRVFQRIGVPRSDFPGPNTPIDRNIFESVRKPLTRLVGGKPAFRLHPRCKMLRKESQGGYHYRRLHTSNERYSERPEKNAYESCHGCPAVTTDGSRPYTGAPTLQRAGVRFRSTLPDAS